MKTLIVFYSHSTNNRLLAHELQQRLGCDILSIEEEKKRTKLTIILDRLFSRIPRLREYNVPIDQYDSFILVSPVWAGAIATPLKAFLLKEQGYIDHYSFITVCGGAIGQREQIKEELELYTHQEPEKVLELRILDLVPMDRKADAKYMMSYRVTVEDLQKFSSEIGSFLQPYMVAT